IHRRAVLGLVAPVDGGVVAHEPGAAQVDANNGVEVGDIHVEDHAVAQDARVVDDNVERAPLLDGGVDQVFRTCFIRNVIAVGDGFAAHRADLVDDFAGGAG